MTSLRQRSHPLNDLPRVTDDLGPFRGMVWAAALVAPFWLVLGVLIWCLSR